MGLDTALSETMRDALMPEIVKLFDSMLTEIHRLSASVEALSEQVDRLSNPDRPVSRKEAAELMGVSLSTVDRRAAKGKLKKLDVGGAPRFCLRDVLGLSGIEEEVRA